MDQQQIDALAAADPTNNDWGQGVDPGERKVNPQVTSAAYKYYGAWHNLGHVVRDENVTAEQLLVLGGADYPIFRSPIRADVQAPVAKGSPIEIVHEIVDPNTTNICRLNPESGIPEILGQASPNYPLWSNRDVFLGFADRIIDDAKPTASTCVVLRGGRQCVMSFELPEGIQVGGMADFDEQARVWIVVDTSYDQKSPTTAHISTIRPVCINTLRAGRAQGFASYVVRKTKNADLKVQMARDVLGLVPKFTAAAKAEFDELLSVQVTNDRFEKLVSGLFGPGDDPSKAQAERWQVKIDHLNRLFRDAHTQANIRNTGWAAVNAVGEYCDHIQKLKKPKDGQNAEAARFWRSLSGEKSVTSPKIHITDAVLALV